MQTIITKYHGPTNHRGTRIIARQNGGYYQLSATSIIHNYDYELDTTDNHAAAAGKLKEALRWQGEMVGGGFKDGYVWVFRGDGSPVIGEPHSVDKCRCGAALPTQGIPIMGVSAQTGGDDTAVEFCSTECKADARLEDEELEMAAAQRNELSAMLFQAVGGTPEALEAFVYNWNSTKNSEGSLSDA